MAEVTNGTTEPAHFGPVGDAARRVASYCDGAARAHVYTAAFTALAAERAKVEKLREALGQIEGYSEVNGMTRMRMRTIARAALTETQP